MPTATESNPARLFEKTGLGEIKFAWFLNGIALILLALIVRKCWSDIDTYYDSLDYHLPFAAFRAGLLSMTDFRPIAFIVSLYDGYPVIPDLLEGLAWRLTSHLPATNLVGLSGLLVFAAAAARWLKVPFAQILLCLFAVPVILIASTSSYVDLWVNSVTAILVLVLFRAFVKPEVVGLLDIFVGLASFTIAVNSKLPFMPVASIGLFFLAVILWMNRSKLDELSLQWRKLTAPGKAFLFVAMVALIASGYVNTARNWLLFRNPIYPVAVSVGPIHWPGDAGDPRMNDGHSPDYLAHTWQPVKWLLSIVEFDSYDGRQPLWVIDAGSLPSASRANRMGGYFGAYVILNLFWFAFLNRPEFRRYGWRPVLFFACLSLITACLPISHQLRYYSFWMMSLLAINLFLVHETLGSQNSSFQFLFMSGALACLMFVVLANRTYVTPTGYTPERLVSDVGASKSLLSMHLRDDERVCLLGKGLASFAYAPIFHPDIERLTRYHVIVAENESQCEGARKVP